MQQYKTNAHSQADLISMEWCMGIMFIKSSHVVVICSQGQDHWPRLFFTCFLLNHGGEELFFKCSLNF